jgi:hypothetical protein
MNLAIILGPWRSSCLACLLYDTETSSQSEPRHTPRSLSCLQLSSAPTTQVLERFGCQLDSLTNLSRLPLHLETQISITHLAPTFSIPLHPYLHPSLFPPTLSISNFSQPIQQQIFSNISTSNLFDRFQLSPTPYPSTASETRSPRIRTHLLISKKKPKFLEHNIQVILLLWMIGRSRAWIRVSLMLFSMVIWWIGSGGRVVS